MILLRIPDINNIELLTEPLASSIAYNVVKNTLVIDIGAGTSDICLINFKSEIGEIKESKGINFAGNDIDLILEKEYGGGGWRKWKESMCGVNYWDDNTGEEFVDPVDSVDVGNRIVTLSEFRECIRVKVLPKIFELIDLVDSSLYSNVILIGGSCHLPGLKSYFSSKKIHSDINPFTSCSIGACIKASVVFGGRSDEDVRREWGDVVGCDLGIGEGEEFVEIIKRLEGCPVKRSLWFTVPSGQNGVTVILSERVDDQIEKIGEFNFLLSKIDSGNGERKVEVFVECKGGGVFVEVYDEWDWEHRVKFGRMRKGDEEGVRKSGREIGLMMLVIFLAGIWLAARIAFNVVIENEVVGEGEGGEEGGGGVEDVKEHEEF
ncbi:hypothetical protein TrLO_g4400 [Triparma laevis f. longispina]|uniref:Actin-like ATPase domain-containing protein n=1 Tax=Triparma laevis f. longispina TaxID=1714387 RepID=A0A9W7DRC4_9STRA|nr:hypothetical protein TrLO_g4400 [Triparma laevis f. longispina]